MGFTLGVVCPTKSGQAIFECESCGKSLSSKGNLKKHKVLHQKEKPFSCDICKSTYNQVRDLKNHIMKAHTGERPHKCKVFLPLEELFPEFFLITHLRLKVLTQKS